MSSYSEHRERVAIWLKLILAGALSCAILWASEEVASSKTMELLMSFKDEGFVNVRGERRGFLSNEGVLKQRIKLFKGQEYLAVVGGDDDVEALTITVLDRKGKETILKSEPGDGKVSLKFTPDDKDKYNFLITALGKGGYYHFSLVTK
jgi:hypothetical protein